MVFLEVIPENFSRVLEKEDKHSNYENIKDFRTVQRQNKSRIAKVSLKPLSSKKEVIEFYTFHVTPLLVPGSFACTVFLENLTKNGTRKAISISS